MVRDLNFDIDIIACPTIRESDGLAMSSRNSLLTEMGRQHAAILFKSLSAAKEMSDQGERRADKIIQHMTQIIQSVDEARIDYISVADSNTLKELQVIRGSTLISLAVFIEHVRLIDNIMIDVL